MAPLDICVGPLEKNAKGAAVAYLSDSQSKPLTFTLGSRESPLRCPFGATAFNDDGAQRVNLDFSCPQDVAEKLHKIDDHIIGELTKHSASYFKKPLERAEIERMWRGTVSDAKEGYLPTCRTKVNLSGGKQVRCWDWETNSKTEIPEFRNAECVPMVHLKAVYFMGSSCGCVYDTTDCLCRIQNTATSPFEGLLSSTCPI